MLFDHSLTLEELIEDYFSHAYGEDWREVVAFYEKMGYQDIDYIVGAVVYGKKYFTED